MQHPPWADLEALFHETLEREPSARAAFLDARCAGQPELQAEIESLVRAHEPAVSALDGPFEPPSESHLAAGSLIGPYQILNELGAGGMGTVYRARDMRLNRTVALKVLRLDFGSLPDARERFRREAEVVASLNHPHICALYDVDLRGEPDYLVMELLDGDTLATRLQRGPLPVDQAIRYAAEIAEGLATAHRKGIVHRDLKPGNIMLMSGASGHVKLLDFGLAKLGAVEPDLAASESPSRNLTARGVVAGTPRYMAPEQVEARATDPRSDIFALGAVLYEMLAGRPAFDGASTAAIIAAVLRHDPDPLSTTRPNVPPALDRLIKRCLAKDPEQRWQSADDLASELRWIAEVGPNGFGASTKATSPPRLWWSLTAAAAALLVVATSVVSWFSGADPPRVQPYRLSLLPPAGATIVTGQPPVISPDGTRVALVITESSGRTRLYLHNLASGEAAALEGSDQGILPFWSPDSQSLGFFAGGAIKTIDLATGTARTVADAPLGRGASWSRDGVILFAPFNQDRLYRVPARGGEVAPVTSVDRAREFGHWWPKFLPDGKHFLYRVQSGDPAVIGVYVASLDSPTGRRLPLVPADGDAVFDRRGYLLFTQGTSLMGQSFDASRLVPVGEPFSIAASAPAFNGQSLLSVSNAGVVVATAGPSDRLLTWHDLAGQVLQSVSARPTLALGVALSRDGARALVADQADVWLFDLSRGVPIRLTSARGDDGFVIWSADEKQAIFASNRNGAYEIWRTPVDGSGPDEPLLQIDHNVFPTGASPDGRWLLVNSPGNGGGFDIAALDLQNARRVVPLLNSTFEERGASFSPDGRWFAYVSNEAGGQLELFLARFPEADRRIRVSVGGAARPRWSGNGQELFYVRDDGQMMRAPLKNSRDELVVGTPQPLFQTRLDVPNLPFWGRYDVTTDGQRFLMLDPAPNSASSVVKVMLDWRAR
jgi:eukaryotic-like serine/threonine-protein kinase